MPASDAASNASTATLNASRRRVLRWDELEDGMIGLADHSVKHAVVQALTSVIPASSLPAKSHFRRDLATLSVNRGRFRPFLVAHKPRGRQAPGRIVLMTTFDGRPVQEVDVCSQGLAVPLGTVTPPWPAADSPRIQISPEWTAENSYALAFLVKLEPGRHPKRYKAAPCGARYHVEEDELERLREMCQERADALAGLSREQLMAALLASYEAHVALYKSAKGSIATAARTQVSVMPSITEDTAVVVEDDAEVAPPNIDQEGLAPEKEKVKRRRSASSRTSGARRRQSGAA